MIRTLSSPTHSGEPEAYIAQPDSFFSNLKGWEDALWEIWLNDGGSEPIEMISIESLFTPEEDGEEEPDSLMKNWWIAIVVVALIVVLPAARLHKKPRALEAEADEAEMNGLGAFEEESGLEKEDFDT